MRAILDNDVAIKAARKGTLPYPDGSIVARLAWNYDPLAESEKAFGSPQSFVTGRPKNGVQFMIKDSSKYASTGGWGYAQFNEGKPADVISRNDFVRNGSPQIQRSLRGLRVLTQGPPRGPRGADEPRAIAKPAGCDGNGS